MSTVEPGQRESNESSSKGLTLGAYVAIGAGAFVVVELIAYGVTHFERVNRDSEFAETKIETVEVIVAAKDLPVNTCMTKDEIPRLVKRKQVAKEALPAKFIVDEAELLDKRLTRGVASESTFDPDKLSPLIVLPGGKDVISIQLSISGAASSFIGPGSHVDIFATLRIGHNLNAVPLLVDMRVITVDKLTKATTNNTQDIITVSLAVTQDEALLLSLAKKRDCYLDLILRHPNKPPDSSYSIAKVKQLLMEDAK